MRRPSPARGDRAQRGFTLIELLVALAVMSLLAILSWRSIDGMNRAQTITQERSDVLLRMQSGLGQWGADLDAVLDTQEVTPLEFDGRVLRLTRRDSAESELDSGGIRVVAWAIKTATGGESASRGPQWSRWQSPPIVRRDQLAAAWQRASEWGRDAQVSKAASANDTELALFGATNWQLFYHRGEAWTNPLSSVGAETSETLNTTTEGLPNGVRLILTLANGQSMSGDLVRDWVRPTLGVGR